MTRTSATRRSAQARAASATGLAPEERAESAPGLAPQERAESAAELSARACRWLARRDRSRAEMRTYLGRHCGDPGLISAVIEALVARGWLAETRLAEQMVRLRRSRGSAQRVRYEMKRRGICGDVIEQSTAGLEEGDLPQAMRMLRRRFARPPADRAERERQLRFLLNRGFSRETARKAMQSDGSDDELESGR